MLTTSRSACRPASSGPRGPRSGEVGIALLVVVRAGPGLLASSVSGIGSTWGRPRSVDGSTALITARIDGRRCKGGVSAAGEAPRCSSSCVALLSEKGETEAEPTNGTRERERETRGQTWAGRFIVRNWIRRRRNQRPRQVQVWRRVAGSHCLGGAGQT